MELRWGIGWATVASLVAVVCAIPASLVEEIKASELRENKVKRAHSQLNNAEEHVRDVPYYSKPTAIKRGFGGAVPGSNLKNPSPEEQRMNEWEQQQTIYQNPDSLASIQSTLYNSGENPDEKTVAEYEKGFHYGINKEKLDEALENAVLKSELYGDPAAINQYRYYGNEDARRRRRRDAKRYRLDSRSKRETELSPDQILTILTLYENERQNAALNRLPWLEQETDADEADEEESWMDGPVYPHASGLANDLGPSYIMEDKRGRWGGLADRKKRFMVAKKRNDPTRELRYLNGPSKNDFYMLSQLLSNQREPNVPLYHRLVL